MDNRNYQISLKGRVGLFCLFIPVFSASVLMFAGCKTTSEYRQDADKSAYNVIQEKQEAAFGRSSDFTIERPSDILRRRLLIEQGLPYSGEASLGTDQVKTIDDWPDEEYPKKDGLESGRDFVIKKDEALQLNLIQALQVGAANSSEYQTKKEAVFQKALNLDLQRSNFSGTLEGGVADAGLVMDSDGTKKAQIRAPKGNTLNFSKKFRNGMTFAAGLALDLTRVLTAGGSSALGISGDASFTIPLLGGNRYRDAENLTQAERDVIYSIWEFERFKKTYAVNVAGDYLNVLKQQNKVENGAENYRNSIASANRTRSLADAGRATEIQIDQAVQNELKARNGWISAIESYNSLLDKFKTRIGLPPDANITVDRTALDVLVKATGDMQAEILAEEQDSSSEVVAEGEEIKLAPPDNRYAGDLEMESSQAIELGLNNRLDLFVAIGKIYDAQRDIIIKADELGADLSLNNQIRFDQKGYNLSNGTGELDLLNDFEFSSLLTLDLPFNRDEERKNYRSSVINLEKTVRDVQNKEDDIKLSIRNGLRSMSERRESFQIQTMAVAVAEKRNTSTQMFFEAGRAEIRDLLEAQEDLLTARNNLTAAIVEYRVAVLGFQRDTGLLQIDENGLLLEYSPEKGGS
ncbi:MAG: TolC family protein [Deltaproteobacteria bacterium]|nr:TolC family protein [Deltaproteobacteria bacterium]